MTYLLDDSFTLGTFANEEHLLNSVGKFDNVPPACMNLAVALSGSCTGEGPRPTPCGSACMQYSGLSDDQFRQLSSYLS